MDMYSRAKRLYSVIFKYKQGIFPVDSLQFRFLIVPFLQRAIRKAQSRDTTDGEGIFFLMLQMQKHSGWCFSVQSSGNFHQCETWKVSEVIEINTKSMKLNVIV